MTAAVADMVFPPAITVWRPWTTLILHFAKDVENRTWSTRYRGLVLIHAAQRWDPAGMWTADDRGIDTPPEPADHPTGIVGFAYLSDVCTDSRSLGTCECGPWAVPGHCHWRLLNRTPLPRPVPCGGQQALWWPKNPQVQRSVAEQMQELGALL